MGKKGRKLKQCPKSSSKEPTLPNASPQYTIDQLMDKAEEYIDTFEFEMAQKFCQRALELEPDNLRVIQTSGTLLIELGDLDNAKRCFGRAIELEPANGHSKYMYMGQLLTGLEAINCFLVGIKLMKEQLEEQIEGASNSVQNQPSQGDISQAHCNIAEIYLTDACFEENAEKECQKNLEEAITAHPNNPEAHHLMASFWLSKDDKQKATESLEKGISLWLPQLKKTHSEDVEESTEESDPVIPCKVSYPGRINAAKLCIEVGKYELCAEILELLLDEDDEVLEVWYLLGWSNHLQGEDYKSTARFYLQKAQQVSKKIECEDKQMVAHVNELLEELGPEEEAEEIEEENGDNGITFDEDDDDGIEESMEH